MQPNFTVATGGCSESTGHTAAWGKLTLKCSLLATVSLGTTGCSSCWLRLSTARNTSVLLQGVLHYAFNGNTIFFWPAAGVTAANVTAAILKGDSLTLAYRWAGVGSIT